ncbi:MAG: 2,3,4,5-tetrahydropyridine-2,6-carboxylate N-succinyltransferase [Flavisolibacter sp.]|nr:2,3,4,5-tetrahydropyridine-2,6-carboxylate N-succinyltransferase [Flavisolibacter sp.]
MFLGIPFHALLLQPKISYISDLWNMRVFEFLFEAIHTVRMPLFFCLSGYLSALLFAKYGVRNFVINRIERIFIPFIFSLFTIGVFCHFLTVIMTYQQQNHSITESVRLAFLNFDLSAFFLIPPTHLWFLYYLIFYLAILVLIRVLFIFLSKTKAVRFSPFKSVNPKFVIFFFILLSFIATYYLFSNDWGKAPHLTFEILPYYFVYYFYFFAFGCINFYLKSNFELTFIKKYSSLFLIIAAFITFLKFYPITNLNVSFWVKLIFIHNIALWLFFFGLLGTGQKISNRESKLVRYFSDSSYWVYLVHVPILLTMKIVFPDGVSLISFLTLLLVVLLISLFSYHFLVRNTIIGAILNGKRQENSINIFYNIKIHLTKQTKPVLLRLKNILSY